MPDTKAVSDKTVQASRSVWKEVFGQVFDLGGAADAARSYASDAAKSTIAAPANATAIGGALLSLFATAAAKILEAVTSAKEGGQPGIHNLVASALGDVLLLDIKGDDIPVAKGVAGQKSVNVALGKKFLDVILNFFGANGAVTGDSATAAAEAFVGFCMQFSASVGFLGVLGEMFSFGNVHELAEVGEVLERSLGLGRLMRQVMAPYTRTLIQKPLERKLNAQYRQDILGAHELIKAIFRGGKIADQARSLLAQHGLPEDQIDELVDQLRPHLSEAELDTLVFSGDIDQVQADAHITAAGVPRSVADLRFRAITQQRLGRLREAGISQVVSEVRKGFLSMIDLEAAFTTFEIPLLERDLWRKRAQIAEQSPHRRLSHGDMLFLYEAGQLTLDEVGNWAAAQGFSSEDQQRLQILFTLKAATAHSGKSGGAAAKAVHTHNEHVAYVTDEITGLWGRAPTPTELSYWVDKLDMGDRTKHDFVTELKGLPTTGPAIPQGA